MEGMTSQNLKSEMMKAIEAEVEALVAWEAKSETMTLNFRRSLCQDQFDRPFVTHGLALGCVRMNLHPIQTHIPKFQHPVYLR